MSTTDKVIQRGLPGFAKEAYARHAVYSISERAFPDIRDGQIPVKRRIMWAMYELKMSHDKARVKSARVVGEVIGNYHPHGDKSVYGAMEKMAQWFESNYMLTDPQGNWGTLMGDPAAAMRYTEIRPSVGMEYMLQDIEKGIVDMEYNFDNTKLEPTVLPSVLPALLINGHSGIGSAENTSFLPHNLDDSLDAVIYVLTNENPTIEGVVNILQAPDFPTGGEILNGDDMLSIYEKGRGTLWLQGKYEVDGKKVIVHSLPYKLKTDVFDTRLSDAINKGKINPKDHSAFGAGCVLTFATPEAAEEGLVLLKRHVGLVSSQNVIMKAMGPDGLKSYNILEMCQDFITHRIQMVQKAYNYRIEKQSRILEEQEGLRIAILNKDKVLQVLKENSTRPEAVVGLMAIGDLTKSQAEYILSQQIHRLLNGELLPIEKRIGELKQKIQEYKSVVATPESIRLHIAQELEACKNGVERKTTIHGDGHQSKKRLKEIAIEKAEEEKKLSQVSEVESEGDTEVLLPNGKTVTLDANHVIATIKANGIIENVRAASYVPEEGSISFHDPDREYFAVLKNGVIGGIPTDSLEKNIYISAYREQDCLVGAFQHIDFTHLVVMTNKGRIASIPSDSFKGVASSIPLLTLCNQEGEYVTEAYRVDNSGQNHCVVSFNEKGEYCKTILSDMKWSNHTRPMDSIPFSKGENYIMKIVPSDAEIKVTSDRGEEIKIALSNYYAMPRSSELSKYKIKFKEKGKSIVAGVEPC